MVMPHGGHELGFRCTVNTGQTAPAPRSFLNFPVFLGKSIPVEPKMPLQLLLFFRLPALCTKYFSLPIKEDMYIIYM